MPCKVWCVGYGRRDLHTYNHHLLDTFATLVAQGSWTHPQEGDICIPDEVIWI